MSVSEFFTFMHPLMERWDFSKRSGGISLKETIHAFILSQGFDGTIVLDPFHNDILNYTINYFKERIEQDRRPNVLSKVISLFISDYSYLDIETIIDLRKESLIIEFRNTITRISEEINDVEDIDSYISGLWTQELLKDINSFAPATTGNFLLNTIIDLAVSLPIIPVPPVLTLQLMAGLAKMAYDKGKELDRMQQYNRSLSHFCTELRARSIPLGNFL